MSGKQPAAFDIHIDRLADQVQEALVSNISLTREDVEDEVRQLAQAGFAQHEGPPLDVMIENRVLEKYQEPAIHRRPELQVFLRPITQAWNDVSEFTEQRDYNQ